MISGSRWNSRGHPKGRPTNREPDLYRKARRLDRKRWTPTPLANAPSLFDGWPRFLSASRAIGCERMKAREIGG